MILRPEDVLNYIKNLFIYLGPAPKDWGQVCGIGKSQSPIDVPTHKLKKQFYNPFIFHGYDKEITSAKIVNNGHTIQLNPGEVADHLMPTVRKL